MSSQDVSSNFHLSDSGSRLLSESLLSASSSRTGHGGDDLSLSELSLHDRPLHPPRRKFSLFAQPPSPIEADESAVVEDDEVEELVEGGLDETMRPEDIEKAQRTATKSREEKLQADLHTLKKMNSALEAYKDMLREVKSNTDRVADKLAHTNALLDKYVAILCKSEVVTRLILDERWEGAEADEERLEREIREETERIRREEEQRALAAQQERERLEREEEERRLKAEQERLERERQESARSGSRGSGVRGVRGTRASMRGTRGSMTSSRGSTASTRGSSRASTARK
ncbi:hypothetical protein BC835DRAFT_776212 [Cytidiella melzeri]|nr:hypothetical protein BC835DRAFT_776212 [Cytidiella melzeri]